MGELIRLGLAKDRHGNRGGAGPGEPTRRKSGLPDLRT